MNNSKTIRLHIPAINSSDKKGSNVASWAVSQATSNKTTSKKSKTTTKKVKVSADEKARKIAPTLEAIHSTMTVDIPRYSEARPKGRISAVNLRSSCSLMGGRPTVFTLDGRHRLEVRSNVHGWAYNEYVAVRVLGNGQYAGMVLVKRSDIEVINVYTGDLN